MKAGCWRIFFLPLTDVKAQQSERIHHGSEFIIDLNRAGC